MANRVVPLVPLPPFPWRNAVHARAEPTHPVDLDANRIQDDDELRKIMLRRSLDPQPVPPPPIDLREERRILLFRRLGLAVIFAALAALIIVALLGGIERKAGMEQKSQSGASLWSRLFGAVASQQPLAAGPMLRLPAQNRSNVANQPIPLGIGLSTPAPGASVVIAGLVAGTKLTIGAPRGVHGWRIATGDIVHAFVVPPLDYVGAMDLAVDLRLANQAIADRNVVHLNWTPAKTKVPTKTVRPDIWSVNRAKPPMAAMASAPAPAKSDAFAPPVARALDHEEIAALIKRGKELIGRSDISAARLVLRRAAEGGSARAAFALAASYDPAFLEQIGVAGAKPDIAKARTWYGRAAALGSTAAPLHLKRLGHQAD